MLVVDDELCRISNMKQIEIVLFVHHSNPEISLPWNNLALSTTIMVLFDVHSK